MSITGQQNINIGLPNESVGSDPLFTAFTKTQQNFTQLFACASPYSTFTAGSGIGVTANATTGVVSIINAGVTNLIAGTNIVLSGSTGNITISSTGGTGNGGGTVTSVGLIPSSRLSVTGGPIVSSGNFNIDLSTSGVVAGTYASANITVDQYGRVTSVANGTSGGTVTSVGLVPGAGIQINGGPVTSSGNITVTNTGVTQLSAGSGISLTGSTGNITISAASLGGTVTSVGVSSSQLVVTNSPIVAAGTIGIDLPANATFSGYVTANGFLSNSTYSGSYSDGLVLDYSTGNARLTTGAADGILLRNNGIASPTTLLGIDAGGNATVTGSTTIGTFMKLTPGTAPGSPTAGMVYYDSGSNTLKCYNGTAWKTITMA